MPTERLIKISEDGKSITMLYCDGTDGLFGPLGKMEMVRTGYVRFDHEDQLWYVFLRRTGSHPKGSILRLSPGYKTREEAVQREVRTCEANLEEGYADTWINILMEERENNQEGHLCSG